MVRLTGPLFSQKAQKQLGHALIYKTKKGRSFLTKYNKPGGVNPFKISQKQQNWRDYYNAAANTWGNLTDEEKQSWNDTAKNKNLKMSGWNLFYKTMADNGPLLVTSGGIIMWSGMIADIPKGWVWCDGNNDTPDLRDKFIVAATEDGGGFAKTRLEGGLTKQGGAVAHQHYFSGDGHDHGAGDTELVVAPNGVSVWKGGVRSTSDPAEGQTDETEAPQPYFALAFIMKI